jgi:hypothetical protein
MRSPLCLVVLMLLLRATLAVGAESPVGMWKTVDDKSGKPKTCTHCYKAEIWVEDSQLKVRGYLGFFYTTQTWLKGN